MGTRVLLLVSDPRLASKSLGKRVAALIQRKLVHPPVASMVDHSYVANAVLIPKATASVPRRRYGSISIDCHGKLWICTFFPFTHG